jgi:hypothetical protein
MLFLAILIASTAAIAGSAAFFSVYGLAHVFSGVFWSTAIMGASLEAGKLVACSYLYRYWTQTPFALKAYLLAGVVALMALTSGGIFGYLSTGYQQDVLPLKQKTEQVQLLTEERTRALARKKQIDDILASGPLVNTSKSDASTARVLREATKSKESTSKQFRDEQQQTTARVSELDNQLLKLKQDLISTEAHIGPITYIAKAFDVQTDDATKWLIFLIILAFDPMAIALTIAANNVLSIRKEEQDSKQQVPALLSSPAAVEPLIPEVKHYTMNVPPVIVKAHEPVAPVADTLAPVVHIQEEPFVPQTPLGLVPLEAEPLNEPPMDVPSIIKEANTPSVKDEETPLVTAEDTLPKFRRDRAFSGMWSTSQPPMDKVSELMAYHRTLQAKLSDGEALSAEEDWEKKAIEEILRRHHLDMYL